MFSVDLFHLSVGVVDLLHQVGEFINGGSLFFENAKTKFNHSVDAVSEGDGVYKGETGCQLIDFVQGPHKVFEGLVALVDLSNLDPSYLRFEAIRIHLVRSLTEVCLA